MKVLKIVLLVIIWPVGLGYLIVWGVKKYKQKKVLANIDFEQDEKLQAYIELASQEKDAIMKNIILISFINYFNKTYPNAQNCEYIKPYLQMSKKHEVLGVFKNNQITQKGKEQLKSLYEHRYKIADDCDKLINTTKNPETFFSRYNLLVHHLERLAIIEEFIQPPIDNYLTSNARLAKIKENKQIYIANLIARTTKQYFKKFLDYINELDDANKEKVNQLI